MAKTPLTKAKEKAWKAFSRYIRRRDCLFENGFRTDYAACCTCGKVDTWRSLQAGHFVPGRRNSTLFDEQNCHAQCTSCNMFKGGNLIPYFLFMEQKYGRDTINRLRAANNETVKYTADDYKRIETLYKAKFAKVDQ